VFFPGAGASVVQWGTSGIGFTLYAIMILTALLVCICLRRSNRKDDVSTRGRKSTVPVQQEDIRYSTEARYTHPAVQSPPKKTVQVVPLKAKEPEYSDDESASSYSQSKQEQPALLTEDFPVFSKTPQKTNFVPPLQSRLRSESVSSRNRGTLSREYASNNGSRLYEENNN